MAQKAIRNSAVKVNSEELMLPCEWQLCSAVFKCMNTFTEHVNSHMVEYFNNKSEDNREERRCHWRECRSEIDEEAVYYVRHLYFHLFHEKIKCVGTLLLAKTGRENCLFDTQSRNMVPELPESFVCGWLECNVRLENADQFYKHVQSHTDCYPDGNHVTGGCKCLWQGCAMCVKSRHKLRDHLKSHTQEKVVACPTCGALFSCRTKFFDHLTRQPGYSTGKQYQCSHCNSTFGAERLLRDHMRYHVNQYKCPFCDMTCPSPSNMQLHIKYRHSSEKPYKCLACEYRAKSPADLKSHQETHSSGEEFRCEMPECNYVTKNFRTFQMHFRREHESDKPVYECHVCASSFSRGALLSKHLKSKHNFNWPSGHSRFRYKCHADGKWRLQTIRYESVDLQTQESTDHLATPEHMDDDMKEDDTMEVSADSNIATEHETVEGEGSGKQMELEHTIYHMPKLVDSNSSLNVSASQNNICVITVRKKCKSEADLVEEDQESFVGGQGGNDDNDDNDDDFQSQYEADFCEDDSMIEDTDFDNIYDDEEDENTDRTDGENVSVSGQFRSKIVKNIAGRSSQRSGLRNLKKKQLGKFQHFNSGTKSQAEEIEEEPIEIHIEKNSAGEYVMKTGRSYTPIPETVTNALGTEETMLYNLQMLGEVAMQKQKKSQEQ